MASVPDIFYVHKKTLEEVQANSKAGKEITKDHVDKLSGGVEHPDEDEMTPVDMRGIGEDFEDVDKMVEQLGNKGACEAFVKAFEYFEKHKSEIPEDERAQVITSKDWREMLAGDLDEGQEEEMFEGEEEEFFEGGEEEDGEGEDDDDENGVAEVPSDGGGADEDDDDVVAEVPSGGEGDDDGDRDGVAEVPSDGEGDDDDDDDGGVAEVPSDSEGDNDDDDDDDDGTVTSEETAAQNVAQGHYIEYDWQEAPLELCGAAGQWVKHPGQHETETITVEACQKKCDDEVLQCTGFNFIKKWTGYSYEPECHFVTHAISKHSTCAPTPTEGSPEEEAKLFVKLAATSQPPYSS